MPLDRYGVLKARPIAGRQGRGRTPHYHVHAVDGGEDYRVAINVKSKAWPSEVLYHVDDHFEHPLTDALRALPLGFRGQPGEPGHLSLDFIRANLFERRHMRALPHDVPGPDNDLNELLDLWVGRALRDEDALLFAFGERFGPEHQPDRHFGFRPATGIHRVHMNQGSAEAWAGADGTWQDGALLLWFPPVTAGGRTLLRERWVAVFIAFQSQAWHTRDHDGRAIAEHAPEPGAAEEAGAREARGGSGELRIVSAVVNPEGHDAGKEQVTIHNAGPAPVDLAGWAIADINKRRETLDGPTLAPDHSHTIVLSGQAAQLGNNGGLISVIDPRGIKVDGVSYTRSQAKTRGGRLVF